MGKALQVIGGRVTNPGATITALTPNTGDSFTVRSFDSAQKAFLENVWSMQASAGVVRIRSPRLHDQAQGIRVRGLVNNVRPLLPEVADQQLYPQDVLVFEQSGGAAEVDAAAMLVYYPDIGGLDANLATWEEIAPRIVNITTEEQNITTGATAGDWGGSQALNADFDTLKRNVRYALLGYIADTRVLAVGVTGVDTGNLRVGGPGETAPDITSGWFVDLSMRTGKPHIPILNAANIGSTTFDVASTATGAAVNVSLIFAELAG